MPVPVGFGGGVAAVVDGGGGTAVEDGGGGGGGTAVVGTGEPLLGRYWTPEAGQLEDVPTAGRKARC